MADLCAQLHFFVKYKVNTDPLYQKLKVVLSDGTVPGEGEHKMMDYVRNLRLSPDYDPNTRHCFYGSDADLIMLSLLTHEPHFMIIRDEHVVQKRKDGGVQRMELQMTNNYQLIHIEMLREYFMLEFLPLKGQMRMKFDLERIIDDFIFFCFFIGNDFLPSLSALDIAEGSLDKLIEFYKTCLPNMENYITHNGTIYWDRAEPFIWLLGEHENETFKNRIDEMSHSYERKSSIISVSADTMAEAANIAGHSGNARSADHLQAMLRAQLAQKKAKKFQSL
jgi:5'-3' exonuclease